MYECCYVCKQEGIYLFDVLSIITENWELMMMMMMMMMLLLLLLQMIMMMMIIIMESSVEFNTYSIDSIIRQGNFAQVHFNLSLKEKECPDCQKHDSAAQTSPSSSGDIDIA